MAISTRLTELLRIAHPILLAPMDVVADGRLAAAVSRAGDFGMMARNQHSCHQVQSSDCPGSSDAVQR
jgi:NAD(P)H-dependent flavin oxidoreductase YrpB (nitropropane dioxygenase family)